MAFVEESRWRTPPRSATTVLCPASHQFQVSHGSRTGMAADGSSTTLAGRPSPPQSRGTFEPIHTIPPREGPQRSIPEFHPGADAVNARVACQGCAKAVTQPPAGIAGPR